MGPGGVAFLEPRVGLGPSLGEGPESDPRIGQEPGRGVAEPVGPAGTRIRFRWGFYLRRGPLPAVMAHPPILSPLRQVSSRELL